MIGALEAVLSFIGRQVGLRTDTANVDGSLHSKIRELRAYLSNLINVGVYLKQVQASDTVILESLAEVSCGSEGYVKLKQIIVAYSGIYRVSFTVRESGSYEAHGKIYRDGLPYGDEISTESSLTSTVDLWFDAGDSIEIWGEVSNTSSTVYISNFKVCGTLVDTRLPGQVIK
jgi:hypothetical protein